MRADACCRAIVVTTAMMASIACGTYSNDKIIHNVLATGWNDDGTTNSVAEVIRLRWGFVGINPPHTYPKTWVERRGQVVRQGKAVVPLTQVLGDWIDAYARQHGRGFVVMNGGEGCLLVAVTGTVTDCPSGSADKRVVYFLPRSDRLLLTGAPRREGPDAGNAVYTLDLSNNTLQAVDDAFLELPHYGAEGMPCNDASYLGLAADEAAWVVACPLDGLWIVRRGEKPELLHPWDEHVGKPKSSSFGTGRQMEDYQRRFAQGYGLAWSPDGSQLYYCPNVDKTGVFIALETRHVQAATMCLGGAVWSPDGRRIAGTRAGMIADELVVR